MLENEEKFEESNENLNKQTSGRNDDFIARNNLFGQLLMSQKGISG